MPGEMHLQDRETLPLNHVKQDQTKVKKGSSTSQSHYQKNDTQPIEKMQKRMNKDQFVGYCLGNVIKYTERYPYKGTALQDLQKTIQYAYWLYLAEADIIVDPKIHTIDSLPDIN